MKLAIILALALTHASLLHAEDFTLLDKSILKEASVSRSGSDFVIISHAGGVQRVAAKELSPELQTRFKMTPEQVESRLEITKEKKAAARARANTAHEKHLAIINASKSKPRHLNAKELQSIIEPYMELPRAASEYLVADWNRREFLRLNLKDEAAEYRDLRHEKAPAFERLRESQEEPAELEAENKKLTEQNAALRAQIAQLQAEATREKEPRKVIINNPVRYVPVRPFYRPHRPYPRPEPRPIISIKHN